MKAHVKVIVFVGLILSFVSVTAFAGPPKRIVANITTNDVNKAAMAIILTHNLMTERGLEATIFFSVYGIELVNQTDPTPLQPIGENITSMLQDFMKDGGKILVCPLGMKNIAKISEADLIPGAVSKIGAGMDALTQPDTLVMSY